MGVSLNVQRSPTRLAAAPRTEDESEVRAAFFNCIASPKPTARTTTAPMMKGITGALLGCGFTNLGAPPIGTYGGT